MSGNRFEFLELGEDDRAPRRPADADGDASEPLIGRDPIAERGPEGEPLAQVLEVDTRGYRTFLAQAQDEADCSAQSSAIGAGDTAGRGSFRGARHGRRTVQLPRPAWPRTAAVYCSSPTLAPNHRVQRVTPDGGVSPLGHPGSGHGQFRAPRPWRPTRRMPFYVVEQGNNRVQKFGADGTLQLVSGSTDRVRRVSGTDGDRRHTRQRRHLRCNSGNGRVHRFDTRGSFLGLIAAVLPGGAAFSPQALATDAADNLYVADPFANRILRYDPLGRLRRPDNECLPAATRPGL